MCASMYIYEIHDNIEFYDYFDLKSYKKNCCRKGVDQIFPDLIDFCSEAASQIFFSHLKYAKLYVRSCAHGTGTKKLLSI